MQLLRAFGETESIRDCNEIAQMPEFHGPEVTPQRSFRQPIAAGYQHR